MKNICTLFFCCLAIVCPGRLAAQTVFFSQNFNNINYNTMPGWTPVVVNDTFNRWEVGLPQNLGFYNQPGVDYQKALGLRDYYGYITDGLIYTPSIFVGSQLTMWLEFDAFFGAFQYNGGTEAAYVEVSFDNGVSWTKVYSIPGYTLSPGLPGFKKRYVSVPNPGNFASLRIGFRYVDTAHVDYGMMVDNIKLFLPTPKDIQLKEITPSDPRQSYVVLNQPLHLSGTVFNYGTDTITSFAVSYTQDGGMVRTQTFSNVSIPPFTSFPFIHNLPDTITSMGSHPIKMWADLPGDAIHTNDTLTATLYGAAFMPQKKTVVEEGTGTWSIYGPRGIVYLDSFRNDDTVCKISVHNTDVMSVPGYGTYLFNLNWNYIPYFLFDRKNRIDYRVYFDSAAKYKHNFGFADITASGTYSGNTLTVNTSIIPAIDMTRDLRMVLVLTEDNVTGTTTNYNQRNAYTQISPGPMGGYENKPDPVPAADMHYNYVARGIFPDPEGVAGKYPATLNYNSGYQQTFTATLNPLWNYNKLKGTVLLIDYTDTTVLNAQTFIPYPVGIKDRMAPTFNAFVYPNPAMETASLFFELGQTERITISLTDVSGRLLWQQHTAPAAGKNNVLLPVAQLPGGIYFATLQGAGKRQTLKMIVSH